MLFGAFPIVFQQERGWSPGIGGLAFVGVLVGFAIAVLWTIFVENPRYTRKNDAEGWLPPEQRLIPALIGGLLLPCVRERDQSSQPLLILYIPAAESYAILKVDKRDDSRN